MCSRPGTHQVNRMATKTKISVALDWTPNTNHSGFFVAQVRRMHSAHSHTRTCIQTYEQQKTQKYTSQSHCACDACSRTNPLTPVTYMHGRVIHIHIHAQRCTCVPSVSFTRACAIKQAQTLTRTFYAHTRKHTRRRVYTKLRGLKWSSTVHSTTTTRKHRGSVCMPKFLLRVIKRGGLGPTPPPKKNHLAPFFRREGTKPGIVLLTRADTQIPLRRGRNCRAPVQN